MPPLLLDIGALHDCACEDALGEIFKAASLPPPADIWRVVENPWLAAHVEDCTRRFQARLRGLQNALATRLTGTPLGELAKALAPDWQRLSHPALEEARMRLEALDPADYTMQDWWDLVDVLLALYLPDNVIQAESEHLTVRAALAGKLAAAALARGVPDDVAARAVELLPTEFVRIPPRILSPVEASILRFAKASAAINIGDVTEQARSRMRRVCAEHVQAQVLGQKEGTHQHLKTRLLDTFGTLNRDWRRIAVTEAVEAHGQGFIASQQPGARVRRQEAYRGACPFCKKLNGKLFRVVAPTDPKRNGQTDVWVGKTNVGRSAAPRKRVAGELIEREPEEMWWPAAGAQHPHCRGRWIPVRERQEILSPELSSWLDAQLAAAMPKLPVRDQRA